MVPFGVAEATTVRVGHALVRGDRGGIRRAYAAGIALVLGTQALSALVLLGGHDAIAGLYTADAAVAALAASPCCCTRRCSSSRTGSRCCPAGALRRLKDTRCRCGWRRWPTGDRHAGGRGLGLWLGWGPRGMWLGLTAGLSVAALLLARRFLQQQRASPSPATRHRSP